MNIDLALEKIYSLKQFHVKLGLENITNLLNHIDNPQKKIPMFHVAGSNGKGSTCSYLSSILQEYGFKIGLFTSPHFVKFNERIRINSKEISDEYIIDFLENNKNYIDEYKPTFFEISTALAFEYFAYSGVDYAVIETGLGGRLDATNVIDPLASIITSISLEHSHILGDTLEKIATEKAGIIKKCRPVFIGKLHKSATKAIENIASEKKAVLQKIDDIEIQSNEFNLNNSLKGFYQKNNSQLAILTLNKTLRLNNSKLIQKGLDNVIINTGIQGRYESYLNNPNIIFDAAHNIEGISNFLNEFKIDAKKYKHRTVVFGAMKDKEISKMLTLLSQYFTQIYVTSTKYERAANSKDLKSIANKINVEVEETDCPEILVKNQLTESSDSCLVVLGSIYLLGEIKRKLIT